MGWQYADMSMYGLQHASGCLGKDRYRLKEG